MYSFVLNKILLPLGSVFFSGNYSKYLREWKAYDRMDAEALEKLQQEKMTALLAHAQKYVPYYRDLNLGGDASIEDFPILTKSLLREHTDRLISEKYQKGKLEKNHSSGSSGQQSVTFMSYDHKFYIRALQTHWWMWGGYRPGIPLLQTGISPKRTLPKKLKDIFFRTHYLEAFSLNEKKISSVLKKFSKKEPKYLAGYPSALNEIAEVVLQKKTTFPVKGLICYGDKLFPQYKRNFEKAFESPTIINTYGCAEGMLMACTADLPYYYIMTPHVYLEIVNDEGNPVKDGERGHILVSCLTNYAMPLIRYKLGDLGIMLPKEEYPKNRRFNYPLLKEVSGRETEVIKAPNGQTLVVHSFTGIMEYYTQIRQFKAIQRAKDELLIIYLADKEISRDIRQEIEAKFQTLVGHSMEISLERVDSIAASPSGKPQIIEIRSRE